MHFPEVTAKLHTMRKPQEFSIFPVNDGKHIIVQSDKSIGKFDFRTGKGVLNVKGAYFPHLSPLLGAFEYQFPAEFVAACLAECPALDSTIEVPELGLIVNTTVTEF